MVTNSGFCILLPLVEECREQSRLSRELRYRPREQVCLLYPQDINSASASHSDTGASLWYSWGWSIQGAEAGCHLC
jgi:hypothetical protein